MDVINAIPPSEVVASSVSSQLNTATTYDHRITMTFGERLQKKLHRQRHHTKKKHTD